MGWETRAGSSNAYYTRSRKVGGRVIREYLGSWDSPTAQVAAAEDALRQEAQERRREALATLAEADAVGDQGLDDLAAVGDALLGATLVVTGHHRHAHGDWRRRRG